MSFVVNLYRRFARLAHELAKFGSVGAIAFVITIGTGNILHAGLDVGPLTSNGIATVISTTFAYFANRHWTFRHRDRTGLGREYALFFGLNGIGLVITQLFIGFTYYVLDQRNPIAFNVSLIIGTGVATLFRFWSYKKWVFLPMSPPPADAHTGLPEFSPPPVPGHTTGDRPARDRSGAVNGVRPQSHGAQNHGAQNHGAERHGAERRPPADAGHAERHSSRVTRAR
ncbi:GtrA family protein [Actinomadura sp. HBU206391]|uniref:GtrA family protein n=1 Tax=Actinomadura sp. HBU206391 TaxID=2731692 RepID=UPI00164F7E31|nr:GtrA family protein [Actinomadura sp. HBU206391]MBC6458646.1 GtrA family protein [Actinomadura sp. HBU206391]